MARLPVIGPSADDSTWGAILNSYLLTEHNADGTHAAGVSVAAGDLRDLHKPSSLPPGVPAAVAAIDWTLTDPNGDLQTQINNAPANTTVTSLTTNGTIWTVVLAGVPTTPLVVGATVTLSCVPMNYSGLFTIATVLTTSSFTIANTAQPVPVWVSGLLVRKITLGPYIYRAPTNALGLSSTILCGKNMHLAGVPGTSIRGSQRWDDSKWVMTYSYGPTEYWISTPAINSSNTGASIFASDTGAGGSARAIFAIDQVFFNNRALRRVWTTARPNSGEYMVDSYGHIVLADNPKGQLVEVTTLNNNLINDNGTASTAMTFENLDWRHCGSKLAGGATQAMIYIGSSMNGGVPDNGSLRIIKTCTIMHAHGVAIGMYLSPGSIIDNCEIAYNGTGGQIGGDAFTAGMTATLLQSHFTNNLLHDNSGIGYFGFGGGGIKFSNTNNLQLDHNIVYNNAGEGLWLDIGNTEAQFTWNILHHNTGLGAIHFEISGDRGAGSTAGAITVQFRGVPTLIEHNVLWENGWLDVQMGNVGGAGSIFISTSENVTVRNNLLVWNYMPINFLWDMGRGIGGRPVGSGLPATQGAPTGGVDLAGTVAKTSGSAAVVGTGTSFTTAVAAGNIILIPGVANEYFIVSSITDNTHLTLTTNAANTSSGQTAVTSPGPNNVQIYNNFIIGEGNFQNNALNAHAFLLAYASSGSSTGFLAATGSLVGAWNNAYWARCWGNTNSLDGNVSETKWWESVGSSLNTIAGLNATDAGKGYDGLQTSSSWISTTNATPPPAAVTDVIQGTSALLNYDAPFQTFIQQVYAAGMLATMPEGGHGQSSGTQNVTSFNGRETPSNMVVHTANYSIQDWETLVLFDTTAGNLTATLPRAIRYGVADKTMLVIKNVGTANTLTVATLSPELIDGAANTTAAAKGVVRTRPDFNNWWIL